LPPRVEDVHGTVRDFRVVHGRYVVTTESASFCAPVGSSGCAAQGWEDYRLGTLPGSDLAGSYTWEGDFVVHGSREGNLTAVRLPETRLTDRDGIGRQAVHGTVAEVVGNRPLVLRVALSDRNDARGMRYASGDLDIQVLADAAVFLGNGRTGLGLPRGNAETLREYLTDPGGRDFWFVLDAQGRAIRVVLGV
jgi:hypothetical protein